MSGKFYVLFVVARPLTVLACAPSRQALIVILAVTVASFAPAIRVSGWGGLLVGGWAWRHWKHVVRIPPPETAKLWYLCLTVTASLRYRLINIILNKHAQECHAAHSPPLPSTRNLSLHYLPVFLDLL